MSSTSLQKLANKSATPFRRVPLQHDNERLTNFFLFQRRREASSILITIQICRCNVCDERCAAPRGHARKALHR